MVRAVAETVGGADTIETALLLAAGDATGPASFDYFLQELTMPFDVHVNGADHPARAFSAPRIVDFPSPVGLGRHISFLSRTRCSIRAPSARAQCGRGSRSTRRS
jgi:hypothetical protein